MKMTLLLALRSLTTQPVRSFVLAGGFGLGIAAMAGLLGVGEVIVAQSEAPALMGGGDLVVSGAAGPLGSARFVLAHVLGASGLDGRVRVASPSADRPLYLVQGEDAILIRARGGIPSLERKLGDPETAGVELWRDTPADRRWTDPDPADVLRAMDRFHAIPSVEGQDDSWAEWLYFNGQSGETHFYLTFLVGPRVGPDRRQAGVRLQLDRGGRTVNYFDHQEIAESALLAEAPDLRIGGNEVRLEGLTYRIRLALFAENEDRARSRPELTGELILRAVPGGALPPLEIEGANGWVSGYVAPVLSGALEGSLRVGGDVVSLDGGRGYHDHNWGFWKDVTWQWGQVAFEDLSFVYGKIFPPRSAADARRVPGFLIALGPEGPAGHSTQVTIDETEDPATGRVERVRVRAGGAALQLDLELEVEDRVLTRMNRGPVGRGMEFFQMRGRYRVTGRIGAREVDFSARGSAETFRRPSP